ncbi:MAG: hypothetical protein FLDDKLPJ_02843 [Phycisphaerae bacterium]|nr:hypothetical protein [Phycisphaerae bacterium]
MSPAEIGWRIRSRVRDAADARWWSRRAEETKADRVLPAELPQPIGNPDVLGDVLRLSRESLVPEELNEILRRADAAMRHRFTFFDLSDVHLGDVIRWNYEPSAGIETPMSFSSRIDYRDTRVTGDCKLVWEPNRHQHLVALGQAYHLTGDTVYAAEVVAQLESWIEQCPFGFGMNWRSPLELAIRLINWAWTLGLIARSGLPSGPVARRIAECAYRHLWDIRRKYSRFSSANNHLIGEAAGVFVGTAFFNALPGASQARREAQRILVEQMQAQTHADGGNREQAFSYHLFVLEFFLICEAVGRRIGEPFPESFGADLRKMSEFAAAWMEAGDPPMFGDADDGLVLGVGTAEQLGASVLTGVEAAFPGVGLTSAQERRDAHAAWVCGVSGTWRAGKAGLPNPAESLQSRAFPDTGLFLLQGRLPGGEGVSATLDAGPLGFGSIAAHGHADALAMTLRVDGCTFICECGTYDYFTHPEAREFFRSTAAHNTVEIDGCNSSEPLGPFLWGRRAEARCLNWQPTRDGGAVSAEHDGYRSLKGGVVHRRHMILTLTGCELLVKDEVMCGSDHGVRQFWHIGRDCQIDPVGDNAYRLTGRGGVVLVRLDPALKVSLHRGKTDPMMGWFSAGYHRREPISSLIGTARIAGSVTFITRFEFGVADANPAC